MAITIREYFGIKEKTGRVCEGGRSGRDKHLYIAVPVFAKWRIGC